MEYDVYACIKIKLGTFDAETNNGAIKAAQNAKELIEQNIEDLVEISKVYAVKVE
jgi:hypothetical protein